MTPATPKQNYMLLIMWQNAARNVGVKIFWSIRLVAL